MPQNLLPTQRRITNKSLSQLFLLRFSTLALHFCPTMKYWRFCVNLNPTIFCAPRPHWELKKKKRQPLRMVGPQRWTWVETLTWRLVKIWGPSRSRCVTLAFYLCKWLGLELFNFNSDDSRLLNISPRTTSQHRLRPRKESQRSLKSLLLIPWPKRRNCRS